MPLTSSWTRTNSWDHRSSRMDFRIHVSERLLGLHDGPFLELGLKGIAGTLIEMPRLSEDRPDRERLAIRFEQFRKSA
jgi:putative restriction endonuclease